MKLRTFALASAAIGTFVFPAAANAYPIPDPPPRTSQSVDALPAAIGLLADAYRSAPLWQKRGIHEEIVLLVNTGHAAL